MTDNNGSALPADLSKVSTADLMKITGQVDSGAEESGLPRLSINHASEDDEGNSLPRGYYAIKNPKTGEVVFAEQASFRPFIRLFMYSAWDNEAEAFGSQTVQLNTLNGVFYDSTGGERCGRLSKAEMDKLDANSPEYAVQKNVKCNQVIYGIAAANGINAKGEKVQSTLLDNWLNFLKLYAQDAMGNPSDIPERIYSDPAMKLKGTPYYWWADNRIKKKLWTITK